MLWAILVVGIASTTTRVPGEEFKSSNSLATILQEAWDTEEDFSCQSDGIEATTTVTDLVATIEDLLDEVDLETCTRLLKMVENLKTRNDFRRNKLEQGQQETVKHMDQIYNEFINEVAAVKLSFDQRQARLRKETKLSVKPL